MILLDTHSLIWLDCDDTRLGPVARETIAEGLNSDRLAVSAISFWEIAMLIKKGRLRLSSPIFAWKRELLEEGLLEFPVTGDIGVVAGQIDGLHEDPADRLIIATAILGSATLVTADQHILNWNRRLGRQNASI